MNVLVLDGFLSSEGRLQQAVCQALSGQTLDHVRLAEQEIAWCRGCFHCWMITPGECVIKDFGNTIASKYVNSDLVIFLSPVTFGSYSPDLKKAMDRMIPNLSGLFTQYRGETHHIKRYPRYPALAVLGEQEQEDSKAADIFCKLAYRNSLNMYPEAFVSHVFGPGSGIQSELAEVLSQVGVSV